MIQDMRFFHLRSFDAYPTALLIGKKEQMLPHGSVMRMKLAPGPYDIDVYENSRQWPDNLFSMECLIWSADVVKAFQDAGLQGAEFYPLTIKYVENKRLAKQPAPLYYWVRLTEGLPVTPFKKDGVVPCDFSPETGLYDLHPPFGVRRWKFDTAAWKGADLFYPSTVYTHRYYCSSKLKDLVECRSFKNFKFRGAENEEGNEFFV